MIIVIIFSVLGLFIMSKRVHQSILVNKTIKQRLTQKPQLYCGKGRRADAPQNRSEQPGRAD